MNRALARRLARLEKRHPAEWEEQFIQDGVTYIRFGAVLADGTRGPAIIVPCQIEDHRKWEEIAERAHQQMQRERGVPDGPGNSEPPMAPGNPGSST